jgi:hypothetical protein
MESLVVNRPAFKEALVKGLNWLVIHWQAAWVWPGLAKIAQQALNTQAHALISEIEVMLCMYEQVKAELDKDGGASIDWKQIAEAASRSLPACASYVSTLASYVKNNGGGISGELIKDLSEIQKVFACWESGPNRILGSEYISKVDGTKFGRGQQKYPYVKNAMLKANLASPPAKVVDGFCKLLMPAHVAMVMHESRRADVIKAEELMSDARDMCKGYARPHAKVARYVGRLDVRFVLFLAGKNKEAEGVVYKSLDEISTVLRSL